MKPELYFDIGSTESGGSLYRIQHGTEPPSYSYQHSTYDESKDEFKVFETTYPSFKAFWQELTKNKEWFYLHPLYVHPEQRAFVQQQLQHVNWDIHPNKKWQESHQRQWKKVLTDPKDYYNPF
ncbi:hypothetical protein OCK74_02195 [Chitinophagaceae bacterium LB-8]|uniref:Uncharacterized protein n=1 Tax=Paraflavisolibacter caeni TaxID=2982496 RepID=A0A9X2XT33_9BACT|nr:hypothetical protein [Paraflavisolibacter caeni]MCU7547902.1 hypothetical protein [Paraflavisolibacter caeni]